mgnify:CR=1 FL=1
MKGIILAGGSGTRLYPVTVSISKPLLPIYDKPMVYYPLSVLMQADIRDILIITTPEDRENFERLLGDGSQFGVRLSYDVQLEPKGIADAFIIGEAFIGDGNVCLILSDNVFYGPGLSELMQSARKRETGATVFGYQVKDPERFGVVEMDENGKAVSIEEKPEKPKSNYAVTGLYFYDNDVVDMAKKVEFSGRGELEITAINEAYMKRGDLHVEHLGRGFAWLDTGTPHSLAEAATYVEAIQNRQALMVGCPEEIGYEKGWIKRETLIKTGEKMAKNDYGQYLLRLAGKTTP